MAYLSKLPNKVGLDTPIPKVDIKAAGAVSNALAGTVKDAGGLYKQISHTSKLNDMNEAKTKFVEEFDQKIKEVGGPDERGEIMDPESSKVVDYHKYVKENFEKGKQKWAKEYDLKGLTYSSMWSQKVDPHGLAYKREAISTRRAAMKAGFTSAVANMGLDIVVDSVKLANDDTRIKVEDSMVNITNDIGYRLDKRDEDSTKTAFLTQTFKDTQTAIQTHVGEEVNAAGYDKALVKMANVLSALGYKDDHDIAKYAKSNPLEATKYQSEVTSRMNSKTMALMANKWHAAKTTDTKKKLKQYTGNVGEVSKAWKSGLMSSEEASAHAVGNISVVGQVVAGMSDLQKKAYLESPKAFNDLTTSIITSNAAKVSQMYDAYKDIPAASRDKILRNDVMKLADKIYSDSNNGKYGDVYKTMLNHGVTPKNPGNAKAKIINELMASVKSYSESAGTSYNNIHSDLTNDEVKEKKQSAFGNNLKEVTNLIAGGKLSDDFLDNAKLVTKKDLVDNLTGLKDALGAEVVDTKKAAFLSSISAKDNDSLVKAAAIAGDKDLGHRMLSNKIYGPEHAARMYKGKIEPKLYADKLSDIKEFFGENKYTPWSHGENVPKVIAAYNKHHGDMRIDVTETIANRAVAIMNEKGVSPSDATKEAWEGFEDSVIITGTGDDMTVIDKKSWGSDKSATSVARYIKDKLADQSVAESMKKLSGDFGIPDTYSKMLENPTSKESLRAIKQTNAYKREEVLANAAGNTPILQKYGMPTSGTPVGSDGWNAKLEAMQPKRREAFENEMAMAPKVSAALIARAAFKRVQKARVVWQNEGGRMIGYSEDKQEDGKMEPILIPDGKGGLLNYLSQLISMRITINETP